MGFSEGKVHTTTALTKQEYDEIMKTRTRNFYDDSIGNRFSEGSSKKNKRNAET